MWTHYSSPGAVSELEPWAALRPLFRSEDGPRQDMAGITADPTVDDHLLVQVPANMSNDQRRPRFFVH